MREIMLKHREREMTHGTKFKQVFGVSLHRYMDYVLGFDVIKFDAEIMAGKYPDGESCHEAVERIYGKSVAAMLLNLIGEN